MPDKRGSRPVLAPAASDDVRAVLQWTARSFGEAARARYQALIKQAVRDVGVNPDRPGSKEHPEIMIHGARVYHMGFSRTRVVGAKVKEPRHFLLYRRREDGAIEVAAFFTIPTISNAIYLTSTAARAEACVTLVVDAAILSSPPGARAPSFRTRPQHGRTSRLRSHGAARRGPSGPVLSASGR